MTVQIRPPLTNRNVSSITPPPRLTLKPKVFRLGWQYETLCGLLLELLKRRIGTITITIRGWSSFVRLFVRCFVRLFVIPVVHSFLASSGSFGVYFHVTAAFTANDGDNPIVPVYLGGSLGLHVIQRD
jgi:hypothetical protein